MSITHGEEFLELDSQTQLLNQIQDLTSNHSSILSITGSQGAGKTWLAERYLNTDYELQTLSFLNCQSSQSLQQQRSTLLGQLLSDSLMDGEDTLLESLEAYHNKDTPFYTCLIIDNAEHLSNKLLSELTELVAMADTLPQWRINVVMFSAPDALNNAFSELDSLDNVRHLSITPLTSDDITHFLNQQIISQMTDTKKIEKVKKTVSDLNEDVLLGHLVALRDQFTDNKYTKTNKLLILVIAILLVLGVASWWVNYGVDSNISLESGGQAGHSIEAAESSDVTDGTNAIENTDSFNADRFNADQRSDKALLDNEIVTDDIALPKPISAEIHTLDDTSKTSQQRITVSSDTIDALLEEE